ncbi:MAG: hypothetical protein OEY43_09015 [Gammaproteobacteria bacterium]|nr:hypothetical protein [Gammaproteobacteria bacterium]
MICRLNFITRILLVFAIAQPVVYAGSTDFILKAEQWDMPRHGEMLLRQPQLKAVALLWASTPGSRIELRYPGGEEGELWVQELVDWLVALGIPSSALVRQPGSSAEDVIQLVLLGAK